MYVIILKHYQPTLIMCHYICVFKDNFKLFINYSNNTNVEINRLFDTKF